MKMNRLFLSALATFFMLSSCTDIESLGGDEMLPATPPDNTLDNHPLNMYADMVKPEYVALREFKATPGVPQVFVWFDNWSGKEPTGDSSMRGLPDSVTIASNWGGHPKFYWEEFKDEPSKSLSPERRLDMEYVQKVKGTKVVVTLFSAHVGDDMPDGLSSENPAPGYLAVGNSSDPEVIHPGIKKYAEAIYDAVLISGYDGFDWDFEPDVSGGGASNPLWYNPVQAGMFVEELSYWFGAGAVDPSRDRGDRKPVEKRLLFLIDGEVHDSSMRKDWMTYYVDYFVQQAYGATSISNCQNRASGIMNQMSDHIAANRITAAEVVRRMILTENFESYAGTGGGIFTQSSFVYNAGGVNHQIGGFGLYRCGFDYNQTAQKWNFLPVGISNLYRVYRERQAEGLDQYPN